MQLDLVLSVWEVINFWLTFFNRYSYSHGLLLPVWVLADYVFQEIGPFHLVFQISGHKYAFIILLISMGSVVMSMFYFWHYWFVFYLFGWMVINFIDLFKEEGFSFTEFFLLMAYLISVISGLTSFFFAYFRICSFSNFLRWKLRWLILGVSSLIYGINGYKFPSKHCLCHIP